MNLNKYQSTIFYHYKNRKITAKFDLQLCTVPLFFFFKTVFVFYKRSHSTMALYENARAFEFYSHHCRIFYSVSVILLIILSILRVG